MADDPVAELGGRSSRRSEWASPALLALVIGAMTAVMLGSHRSGHWWGDDWALYIRQAQGLLDGEPGRVSADNLFSVDNTQGAAFSPPLYPWGFPIMLAPFVAVLGADVDRLAIVPVLCAVVFACCWYDLAKRRFGWIPALVGVVAVTMTPLLLGWTELIQSEWPFLATVGLALVGLDRLVASGRLVGDTLAWWPLVAVGLGATAAFSVRREGLAVTAAIAAAQVGAITSADMIAKLRDRQRAPGLIARLIAPHAAALAGVVVLQVLLPSTLVPSYSGTSLRNVWRFRRDLVDNLAEIAGFKRTWQDDPVILGSSGVGWTVVVVYLTAAAAGAVLAVTVHRRRDLHFVGYVAGALAIGGSFRSPINRYVVTVAPVLLLLGLVAVAWLAARTPWRRLPVVAVTVMVAAIALGNVVQARTRIENARAFADSGSIEWGPTHPDAIEMFEQVIARTGPDDVVAAPKARAMTLETGRRSVQVDQYRPVPDDVPIALIVTELESPITIDLAQDTTAYESVWRNERFVIFQPSSAASASTNDDGSSSTASP